MAIYRIENGKVRTIEPTTFQQQGMWERRDIQKVLRDSIEVVSPNTMVIAEEFGDWTDGRRRIDLLCLSKDAGLVVVELKRTEDGGHMELQALRYAAMVSAMTFQEIVRAHESYLIKNGIEGIAESRILEFLEWTDPSTETLGQEISIVLVSAEFSKELTTTVMWLNEFDLNITCVRLRPYMLDGQVILNVEQIIPLPEAAEYQVRVRQKEKEERQARTQERDLTRFEIVIGADTFLRQPKRKLAFYIIREAIRRGARPKEVLPDGKSWIVVAGKLSASDFENAAETSRTGESSTSEFRRFFTEEDELFHIDGNTYALTKMWGARTLDIVNKIISTYGLENVSYKPMLE